MLKRTMMAAIRVIDDARKGMRQPSVAKESAIATKRSKQQQHGQKHGCDTIATQRTPVPRRHTHPKYATHQQHSN
jgi:hypothetical protein